MLLLNEDHFQLTIFPKNPNCSELVKNIFYPIKQITYNSFQINYSILQNVFVTNEGCLSFEIFNPVMHYDFSFSVNNIEEQGLVFRKKLKKHQVQSIAKSLLQAKANEIKRLMGSFISMVYLFKDCLETEQNKKQQIENILIPSYLYGKNYYEKNISIFKQNQKLKTSLKKSLMDKIKILESMLPEQEQIKQNLSCSCFDNLLNEFKVRSAVYIEESLQLFFTIINLENDTFDIYKISNSTISDNLKALNLNDNINNLYKHNNNRDQNKSATFIHSKKRNPVLAQLNNENMNLSNDCYFSIKQSSGNKIFNLKAENLSNSTKTTSKKNYCVDVKESLETPKFYLKCTTVGNVTTIRESLQQIDADYKEIPSMFVDAYRGTVNSSKLRSVVNTSAEFRGGTNSANYDSYLESDPFKCLLGKPRTAITRANFRTYARNIGKELLSYDQYKAIFYWNYIIEYANFNS